jgi:hypothetical protein
MDGESELCETRGKEREKRKLLFSFELAVNRVLALLCERTNVG